MADHKATLSRRVNISALLAAICVLAGSLIVKPVRSILALHFPLALLGHFLGEKMVALDIFVKFY